MSMLVIAADFPVILYRDLYFTKITDKNRKSKVIKNGSSFIYSTVLKISFGSAPSLQRSNYS